MIKMLYDGKNYRYEVGCQPYDIKTEIDIVEDANVAEVLTAAIKIMTVAGYHPTKEDVQDAIDEIFDGDFYS